jgi:hypothetical protein
VGRVDKEKCGGVNSTVIHCKNFVTMYPQYNNNNKNKRKKEMRPWVQSLVPQNKKNKSIKIKNQNPKLKTP